MQTSGKHIHFISKTLWEQKQLDWNINKKTRTNTFYWTSGLIGTKPVPDCIRLGGLLCKHFYWDSQLCHVFIASQMQKSDNYHANQVQKIVFSFYHFLRLSDQQCLSIY